MNFINNFFAGGEPHPGGGGQGGRRGGGGHGGRGGPGGPPQYQNFLRAYPGTFMARPELEEGNKILLPSSALSELSQGVMPQPLIFRINSMNSKKTFYVGVLEFVAPEDTVILPFWIFKEMNLNEEELINIFLVPSLPKAQFVKLQPHQTAFIDLPDPKVLYFSK